MIKIVRYGGTTESMKFGSDEEIPSIFLMTDELKS